MYVHVIVWNAYRNALTDHMAWPAIRLVNYSPLEQSRNPPWKFLRVKVSDTWPYLVYFTIDHQLICICVYVCIYMVLVPLIVGHLHISLVLSWYACVVWSILPLFLFLFLSTCVLRTSYFFMLPFRLSCTYLGLSHQIRFAGFLVFKPPQAPKIKQRHGCVGDN